MITCQLMGGLGNQLFQTAVTLAMAKDHNKKAIFPPKTNQGCSRKISYNDSFFHKVERSKVLPKCTLFRENGFCYKPIKISENTQLHGYFQTEKYFEKHKEYILNTITLPTKMENELNSKYQNIINNENTVSVHIRRGDYLRLQHCHYVQTIDYYEKAIKNFPEDSLFVIFSDDLEWCKNQPLFQNLKNKQFVQDVDYKELYVMSRCKHNIIANSSFSWWAAYMNPNNQKKIISPTNWFGPKGPKDLQDLRPSGWIVI